MKGLDSTFIIHLLKRDPGAVSKSLEMDEEPLLFSTEANVYEVASGFFYRYYKDHEALNRALKDIESLLSRVAILPLDRKSALMRQGQQIDDMDCLTAGILLSNGCDTIITRNAKHFSRIKGLTVESY